MAAEFKKGTWNETIDVRDFIQKNYTPYTGDESFLADPTERTIRLREKLDALLAQAVMSIGAVKGVEIGEGFYVAQMRGSQDNDGFAASEKGIVKTSNHAGGIMGGISDGSEILLRAAVKPTPSVSQPQATVTDKGENISLEIHGRHDPVIVPRAVVVVEAMCALTIADALLGNMGARLDKVQEFYKK